jgi:hypothetical protein
LKVEQRAAPARLGEPGRVVPLRVAAFPAMLPVEFLAALPAVFLAALPAVLLSVLLAVFAPAAVHAQTYRARVDASAQSVTFRGLRADSIPREQAVVSASGGLETPGGAAVRCGASGYCFFFAPGTVRHTLPVVASGGLVFWGLGTPGLSIRTNARVIGDAGPDRAWPTTSPSLQILEAFAEYERARWRARAGRLLVMSRLEAVGFDGASVNSRWERAALEVTGYAGSGLAQAAALPISSSALDPLDEWRPRRRQIVTGLDATWTHAIGDARAEYRRELDPGDRNIVSERAAFSASARAGRVRVTGGADYNLAEGHMGSADLALLLPRPGYTVSAGLRRYRPYFSLWTLWGAFSPVPYNAVNASTTVNARDWLALRGRAEWYWYDDAEVSTAVVPTLQDRGWRVSSGATASVGTQWTVDASLGADFGPGAAGRFAELAADYAARSALTVGLHAGLLERPLELRRYDAASRWLGGRVEWQATSQRRLWGELSLVGDDRDRPDASATSLAHVRVRAGVSVIFGSHPDVAPLPPARPLGR